MTAFLVKPRVIEMELVDRILWYS